MSCVTSTPAVTACVSYCDLVSLRQGSKYFTVTSIKGQCAVQVTDEQVDAYFKPLKKDEELHLQEGAVHAYARL